VRDNLSGMIIHIDNGDDNQQPDQPNNNDEPNNPTPNQPNNINVVQLLDQLEAWFTQFNIRLVKKTKDGLSIEFNDNNPTNSTLTPKQQEQISNYLTRTNKNELSLQEIRQERERERERAKVLVARVIYLEY